MVDLCEKWRSLRCHQRFRGMPQTNNCTERLRYKTQRVQEPDLGWVWSGRS